MYFVQKHVIFDFAKRPVASGPLVNRAMFQLINTGPLIFALGNFTWSNFFPNGEPQSALVPNIIACALAFMIIILPFKKILNRFFIK